MSCGGVDCPAWCECVDGVCQPLPDQTNAVRLRTRDGRYLQAIGGGGGNASLAAAAVPPQQWETFRFVPPTALPLAANDLVVLEVCDGTWGPSGNWVRVDATTVKIPNSKLLSYRFGGPGAHVRVTTCCVSRPGYAGWREEWTFWLEKAGGGPIVSGDEVAIATSSGFYFRVTGAHNGAMVDADVNAAGTDDTTFIVEFGQVAVGLGWRPPNVQCQICGTVTGTVTDANTGQPISGATVQAQGSSFTATTDRNGDFTLTNPDGRTCVPAGNITLIVTATNYQPGNTAVAVPAGGAVHSPVQLQCTEVSGRVVDANGQAVPGATVILVEAGLGGNPVARPDGSLIEATTAPDGSFVIGCVPAGNWAMWTDGASSVPVTVPPEGLTGVVITLGCADVIGTVTDEDTDHPIAGAKVKVFGTGPGDDEAITDAAGNFRIQCVTPSGARSLRTTAPGYQPATDGVNVPAAGASAPVDIKLRRVAQRADIMLVLSWGAQPDDLDSHLSGPDGQGGRFHLEWRDVGAPPVSFVGLNVDDRSAHGPETVTVGRSPATGAFVAGEYRYWIHNFNQTTFAGSNAVVTVIQNGILGRFEVAQAVGNPAEDLWHVVNLTVAADGTVNLNVIQTLLPGDTNTQL